MRCEREGERSRVWDRISCSLSACTTHSDKLNRDYPAVPVCIILLNPLPCASGEIATFHLTQPRALGRRTMCCDAHPVRWHDSARSRGSHGMRVAQSGAAACWRDDGSLCALLFLPCAGDGGWNHGDHSRYDSSCHCRLQYA